VLLLRPQGALTLIYRADALVGILNALAADFGSIAVVPIFPKPNAAAIRIVVRAIKGSGGATTVHPGLLLNEQGRPTRTAEAILREGAALSFAA
jgi:tRNA1(Val) A37 N6-methylase TrmN6